MKTSMFGNGGRGAGRLTAVALLALAAASAANAQVTDTKVPLNYNYHGYGHTSEAVTGSTSANADSVLFRSISDRGLYWNPSDTHAFGTNPIVGATGITYALFDTLGYANSTNPGASTYGMDCVHLGNRFWFRGQETSANSGTQTGNAAPWAPIFDVTSLSGNGTTATGTTAAPHGFVVGQTIGIVGANPGGFNGSVTITATPDATTFQYACPASGTATGSIFPNSTSTPQVSGLSISGATVTATTVWPHGFAAGNQLNISGASDAGYNGQFAIATVPTTSSFTYNDLNGPGPTATGTQIIAGTLLHDGEQATTLASPVTLDANSEIGVLYTASDGDSTTGRGGSFDVVLTFSDATTVTTRLHASNWDSATVPSIVSNLVSSQQLIKHTVSGTTSSAFRSVSNADSCNLNAFGTNNIEVVEGIISVPNMTAAGINVVGKSLSKIAFKNAFSNPVQITALTLNGSQATATIATTNNPFIVGQPISISGVAGPTPSVNGNYAIASIANGTTFTFPTTATGTAAAKIYANSLPVTSITLTSGTVGTVVLDAPGQLFNVGDRVTISGANATTGTTYVNGVFTVATATDATHFTYKNNSCTGTVSAQMQVTRPGQNRGYQVHAVTVRKGAATSASCATATVIPTTNAIGTVVNGSNSHATNTPGDPATSSCGTADTAAVYYSYTASGNDPMTLTLCAPFTNSISVFSGVCGALAPVACNASNTANCGGASGNTASTVSFNASAGTTYYFRVAGQSGGMGDFALTVQEFGNVNCAGAVPIAAGDTAGVTLVSANTTTTPCGAAGNDKNSVWYQYTATGSGSHTVEARTCLDLPGVGSSTGAVTLPLDTTLAVYSNCSGGAPIVCNDDGCSVTSRVQWTATPGTTYLIRVATKGTTVGAFTLHIDDPIHTDIQMPIQFNWNGICHGTFVDPNTSVVTSEQTVPLTAPIGATNENRFNQNGYRSIADRSLLFDPNNSVKDALNYGGTLGYQGIVYQLYTTPLQADMVHLGNRTLAGGGRPWAIAGTTWPAEGGTSTNLNGLRPLWLNNDDQTPDQVSSMSGLSAVFGPNTKIGILYQASNVQTVAPFARFDVTLGFTDSTSTVVTLNATDWFYNNTGVLPDSTIASGAGLEKQRVLGIYHGTQNTDQAQDAASPNGIGPLKVDEAVISTASLIAHGFDPTGKTLASMTFGNVRSGNAASDNFSSAIGIFTATIRDPASFNLNFPPSGTGTVTPNQLNAGGTGKMTVSVSRGSGSNNQIASVVVDASTIGLSSTLALNDNGANGDAHANDNVWSRNISFPINTPPNPGFILPFTITDGQSRQATGNIIFSIVAPTGTLTPSAGVLAGFTSVHAAFVFGSAGGISSVVLDASQLGLSSTLSLNDSGAAGDTVANDGTWGVNFVPAAFVAPATYSIPYTITDTSSNTASGTLSITIAPPSGACCTNTTGACAFVVSTSCTGTTNVYNGDNTTCQTGTPSASCPITGICCTNTSGACGLLYGGSCATTATLGSGLTCAAGTPSTSCPIASACCNGTSGACTLIYGGLCPAGATASGGITCDANTCPASGTCCNDSTGACTLVYGGNACGSGTSPSTGTVCDANTCPIVAVCCDVSGVCIAIYGGLCPANSTLASGTTCNGNATCPATGSCCNGATGACTLNYTGSCNSPLTFSASTSCSPTPCTSQPHTCENFDGSGSLPANWTTASSGAGAPFAIVSDQSHSPSNAVFTNDVATASTQSLVLPAVTASGTLTLDFWSYYSCEGTTTFFDGWVVEYSTDGGANWTDVGTGGWALNGYNAAAISTCCTNAIGGRPAFGGSALTWTEHIAAIPAAAGQQVMIRFFMSSDSSIGSTGVWLDDICVAGIQVVTPGVCCRGSTCTMAFTSATDCGANTTTSTTSGPGWAFVTGAGVCNSGVNPDGTYSGGLTSTRTPCCFANYNHNATLEVQDIFDFLNDWFAGRAIAIPGGDGTSRTGLAVQNIFNFLNAWFSGGCH